MSKNDLPMGKRHVILKDRIKNGETGDEIEKERQAIKEYYTKTIPVLRDQGDNYEK